MQTQRRVPVNNRHCSLPTLGHVLANIRQCRSIRYNVPTEKGRWRISETLPCNEFRPLLLIRLLLEQSV